MPMVKFATTCDALGCGRRSPEYTCWPTCRGCSEFFCPEHIDPASYKGGDGEPVTCLCWPCEARGDA